MSELRTVRAGDINLDDLHTAVEVTGLPWGEATGKLTVAGYLVGYNRDEGHMLLIVARGSVISPESLLVAVDDSVLMLDETTAPARSIADLWPSVAEEANTEGPHD